MLQLLLSLAASKSPVILIPGLYGSELVGTYNDFSKHWYCPKKLNQDVFWLNLKYVVPPTFNCLFEMLECYFDENMNTTTSLPGITVDVKDFGGINGVSYVDKGVLGWHLIESFHTLIKHLQGQGYTVKQDLFAAPYDWRLAMNSLQDIFYQRLKLLIEYASDKNNGEPVTLLGYSCGGFVLQNFLSDYVTEDWAKAYVKKVILLAPAFGGSSATLEVAWKHIFPIVSFLKTKAIKKAVQNIPVLHALFPNHVVFGDIPVVTTPEGGHITAAQLPQFLIDHGKVTGSSIKMMQENVQLSARRPNPPPVPILLLYNSAIETVHGMSFPKGYDKDPVFGKTSGDGTVPALGPEWACKEWPSSNISIVCVDVKNPHKEFNHVGLGHNKFILKKIQEYIEDSNWIKIQGKKKVVLEMVEPNGEYDYIVTNDRPEHEEMIF